MTTERLPNPMTPSDDNSPPTKPIRLADRDDLTDLLESHSPVLVDFYTEGCSMCQSIEPVLGNVARATGITVGMVNPRKDPQLIEEYQIRSVPTLSVFTDGTEVGRLAEGFQGADAVVEFINTYTAEESLETLTDR